MKAEEMDRDVCGSLTDLGREQLIAWSVEAGLLDAEPIEVL